MFSIADLAAVLARRRAAPPPPGPSPDASMLIVRRLDDIRGVLERMSASAKVSAAAPWPVAT